MEIPSTNVTLVNDNNILIEIEVPSSQSNHSFIVKMLNHQNESEIILQPLFINGRWYTSYYWYNLSRGQSYVIYIRRKTDKYQSKWNKITTITTSELKLK